MVPPDLRDALIRLAGLLQLARSDWWVIGGTAVALHGVADIAVHDIDVVMDVADARRVLPALGLPLAPGGDSALFRSALFTTWTDAGVPIEFMAGFEHRTDTGWHAMRPATRERIEIGSATVFVPSRAELHDLLRSFGRPKDIARARLLAALD